MEFERRVKKIHYIEGSSDLFVLIRLSTITRIYFIKTGLSRKKYVPDIN